MSENYDPRMRLRCWIDGVLVEETWLDGSNPDGGQLFARAQLRHMKLVDLAEQAGKPWMVEAYDPAKDPEQAYTRIGTDVGGMVDPQPIRDET